MLPPGVAPATGAALEAGLAKTLREKSFLADAAKSKHEITPILGAAIHSIVNDFLNMPPAIKEKLRRTIRK
jgi:hypothetical protein